MSIRVRHVKTRPLVEKGLPVLVEERPIMVPDLDEHGREIELWAVDVPQEIVAEGADAVNAYVEAERAKLPLETPRSDTL